jgi:hypothetical protein
MNSYSQQPLLASSNNLHQQHKSPMPIVKSFSHKNSLTLSPDFISSFNIESKTLDKSNDVSFTSLQAHLNQVNIINIKNKYNSK